MALGPSSFVAGCGGFIVVLLALLLRTAPFDVQSDDLVTLLQVDIGVTTKHTPEVGEEHRRHGAARPGVVSVGNETGPEQQDAADPAPTQVPESRVGEMLHNDLLGDSLDPTDDGRQHQEAAHHRGYVVLLLLFGFLIIGSALYMLQAHWLVKVCPVPYTCLLFVAGFLLAVVHHFKPRDHALTWPNWYLSVELWEAIDPHLLFYVFLPPLIFSEALRLNVYLVKRCLVQILLLAGPGVVIGTALTGLFAKYALPYGWDWGMCFLFGAILSATDPVAVVSLLASLGVSPRLTMLISGESLLNDGTAIVLFTLTLKVVKGATLTPSSMGVFFANMTVLSCLLGFVLASVALYIIGLCAKGERGHGDGMVQLTTTICCAYFCFFIAEAECSTSGVLTLVSAGCTLSQAAWPLFVDRQLINVVWEAFEFIGNTVIFTLAGLLFGGSVLSRASLISSADVGWLLLLYVALIGIRAVMLATLWLVMECVGYRLSPREFLVMVWSGLRGAISLTLAMLVDLEPTISDQKGARILFHVGGIAALTIIINATTCGPLLKALGMTRTSPVQLRKAHHYKRQVAQKARDFLEEAAVREDLRFQGVGDTAGPQEVDALPSAQSTWELAEYAQYYRAFFMEVVLQQYWLALDEDVLPHRSAATQALLDSASRVKMFSESPLSDWHVVQTALDSAEPGCWSISLANWGKTWPLRLLPNSFECLPSKQALQALQALAVLSFQEAHRCATVELQSLGDHQDTVAAEAQRQVAEESEEQLRRAAVFLGTIPADTVQAARHDMLTRRVVKEQQEEIARLVAKGALGEDEAHSLSHDVAHHAPEGGHGKEG